MKFSESELQQILSRPSIARRNPVGGEPVGASVQKQKADTRKAVVHRQKGEAAHESDHHCYRVTINLRYSTKRRRDIDGAASTLLDAIIAARRRLLDNYFRINRDSGTGGD